MGEMQVKFLCNPRKKGGGKRSLREIIAKIFLILRFFGNMVAFLGHFVVYYFGV